MSILFIILTLVLVLAVAIYIIGVKKGESQETIKEGKEVPIDPADDDDDGSLS